MKTNTTDFQNQKSHQKRETRSDKFNMGTDQKLLPSKNQNPFTELSHTDKNYEKLIQKVMAKHYAMLNLYDATPFSDGKVCLKSIYFIDNNKSIAKELEVALKQYTEKALSGVDSEAIKIAVNNAIATFYSRCQQKNSPF